MGIADDRRVERRIAAPAGVGGARPLRGDAALRREREAARIVGIEREHDRIQRDEDGQGRAGEDAIEPAPRRRRGRVRGGAQRRDEPFRTGNR